MAVNPEFGLEKPVRRFMFAQCRPVGLKSGSLLFGLVAGGCGDQNGG